MKDLRVNPGRICLLGVSPGQSRCGMCQHLSRNLDRCDLYTTRLRFSIRLQDYARCKVCKEKEVGGCS